MSRSAVFIYPGLGYFRLEATTLSIYSFQAYGRFCKSSFRLFQNGHVTTQNFVYLWDSESHLIHKLPYQVLARSVQPCGCRPSPTNHLKCLQKQRASPMENKWTVYVADAWIEEGPKTRTVGYRCT